MKKMIFLKSQLRSVIVICGLLFFSFCGQKDQNQFSVHEVKVIESAGREVPGKDLKKPKVVVVDENRLKKVPAGKPKIVPATSNFSGTGSPNVVDAGVPLVNTPGTGTCSVPETVTASGRPIRGGIPESAIAKEMVNKDQNPESFSSFGKQQGIKHGHISCMLQDRSGNLWFGTFGGGATKYDGRCFTYFTEKEGLGKNNVLSIIQDSSGNLWFATYGGGVSKYDGKVFTQFTKKEGLKSNDVYSVLEDKTGNLWFGTIGSGISKYDGKKFTHYSEKEGLCNNTVSVIVEDKSGSLWFGTLGGGVSKFDGKSFTNYTEKEGLPGNLIFSITEDRSGNLWFGTEGNGVSKFDGRTFTKFTEKEGLGANSVQYILEDKTGNLWFGTDGGGLSKFDGKFFSRFTDKEGLNNNTVSVILEDRAGNIWLGTNGGVCRYNGAKFNHFTDKEGLGINGVYGILEDRQGNLWFGTEGGGVSKYDGRSFAQYTIREGLSNNNIYCILEDKSGNLWFGTYGGGLSKYDGKSFTHFTQNDGLCSNGIYCLLEDHSGNIWVGTYGGGVSKFDGKSFTRFTEKEGLINNNVLSILEDKRGSLWFGTRFGLSKLTREKLAVLTDKIKSNNVQKGDVFIKNYTYDDGLLGIGCNRNSILESRTGILWIGTNDRLTAFHPEGEFPDIVPPDIQLTTIELFNEKIDWGILENSKDSSFLLGNGVRVGNFRFDGTSNWYNLPEHLSLAYNNNYVTFNFIGITTVQPRNIKYQYTLDGADENWSAISSRNSAPYGNLSPGTYTFRVKAMNSEGVWSKEFSYPFSIRPPWWKTWWMFIVYGLMAAGSILFLVWWNSRRLQKRANELQAEVEKATIVIQEQKEDVVAEKKKSDELLLNILPAEVALELKQTGRCQPKTYSMVTVMFTDFKDFTTVSERISAELLVSEIDYCFSAFDAILQKYKIEKIKTIGDAYMCAAGLPVLSHTHANDMVNAAIEIRNFMMDRRKEKEKLGEIPFDLRLGIHTGPVVAGIVGKKKYVYDIWGDTVNIAARMEQNSEAGKINISGSTHLLVKDQFACTYRGKIQAKNKGEIDMFFVESKPA